MSTNNNKNFNFSAYCGENKIFNMEITDGYLSVSYINDDYFKLFPNEKIRLEYVKTKFKEFIKFNNNISYELTITLLSIYKPEFMDKDMILLWKFKREFCDDYSEEMLNGSIIDKKYIKTLNIGNLSICTGEDYFNIVKDTFNKFNFNTIGNDYFKRFLNSIYSPQQPMTINDQYFPNIPYKHDTQNKRTIEIDYDSFIKFKKQFDELKELLINKNIL